MSMSLLRLRIGQNMLVQKSKIHSTGVCAPAHCHARYYSSMVKFFGDVIARLGVGETLEQYLFSPAASGNGTNMLLRFIGGA